MYATQQDIIDRYGENLLLQIADSDGSGSVDSAAIARAEADASAEINVYLAAKYALPLATVPAALTRIAVDIMVYRLAATADVGTEEQRKRYEDVVALLKAIANGTASLGLTLGETPTSSNGVVFVAGPKRLFTRRSVR